MMPYLLFVFFEIPPTFHTAPAVCIGTCNCALLLLAAPLEFWRPKTASIITRGNLMRDEVSFPRVYQGIPILIIRNSLCY